MVTPGRLWPKIDECEVGFRLALTGTSRDEILDLEELACRLIATLKQEAPGALEGRYGVDLSESDDTYDCLCALARRRGFIVSGGDVDTERMSRVLLDEFRSGKLGRITLESPGEV